MQRRITHGFIKPAPSKCHFTSASNIKIDRVGKGSNAVQARQKSSPFQDTCDYMITKHLLVFLFIIFSPISCISQPITPWVNIDNNSELYRIKVVEIYRIISKVATHYNNAKMSISGNEIKMRGETMASILY